MREELTIPHSRSRLLVTRVQRQMNEGFMRKLGTLLLQITICFYGSVASADFRLQHAAPEDSTAFLPVSPVPDERVPKRQSQVTIRPRVFLAVGFGRQIPLSFAARQIVPASLSVSFAPDVNQDALVDWSGGRPWNQVITAVVQPLRLRAVVTARGVLIGP